MRCIGLLLVALLMDSGSATALGAQLSARPRTGSLSASRAHAHCPCVYALDMPRKRREAHLTAYAEKAQGDVAPAFKLFSGGWGLAVDAQGYMYMSTTGNSFVVYAPNARGDATPVRTVAGPDTNLNGSTGIAVDDDGDVYIGDDGYAGSGPYYVTVYPPGANGDVAPIQTISGSNTGINAPWSVAVDSEHNIYVDNVGADSITVFAAGANGNATPIQTISGSNTGLDYSWGIAADSAKNIYVTGTRFNLLNVFAPGATGNAVPIRSISGSNTELGWPMGVAVDAKGDAYVLNQNNIAVFGPTANGNVAPIRTIAGSRTRLSPGWIGLALSQ